MKVIFVSSSASNISVITEVLSEIEITSYSTGSSEKASIVLLDELTADTKIDDIWWNETNLSEEKYREMDSHWMWKDIVNKYGESLFNECRAIYSRFEHIEGAIAFQLNAQSKLEEGFGCVYVGWLATAPRNRPWLTTEPVYKGIGSALLLEAVRESYRLGLSGRVSLQSLPSENTLGFYNRKGFKRTDPSQDDSNLVDFELPSKNALEWLRKEGELL